MNDHPSSIHVPEYEPQSLNECIVARMSAPTIGTLRYQDGELGRGRHCKSKTGTSPVVAAKNKILKIVYFCVGRRRRYFSLYNSNDIL